MESRRLVATWSPRFAWRMLLVGLLVLGLPLVAAAQNATGRITGVVTDSTGGVMPGVTIDVKGPANVASSTVTDSNGKYLIEKLAPGTYTLTFQLAGFATQSIPSSSSPARRLPSKPNCRSAPGPRRSRSPAR